MNPSKFTACGASCSVEQVSWYDAVRMVNKLSEREGLNVCYKIGKGEKPKVSLKNNCKGWRLPTEAEWEYAARGGEQMRFSGGETIEDVAWYGKNSQKSPHKVCEKKENAFGLCDMSGNVWEWVGDGKRVYTSKSVKNPIVKKAKKRVLRGGGWGNSAKKNRLSNRNQGPPSGKKEFIGFRLVQKHSKAKDKP